MANFLKQLTKRFIGDNTIKAYGLLPDTRTRPGDFTRQLYFIQDNETGINPSDRKHAVATARDCINKSGLITQAMEQKINWSFSPNGYDFVYSGDDKAWGNLVATWVTKTWYQHCNSRGPQFNFKTSIRTAARALITDGEILLVHTTSDTGYPFIRFFHSDRIESPSSDLVKTGPYEGFRIFDGCILSEDTGKTIAYNIKGKTDKEDQQIDARDCYLIFDPRYQDRNRGIPPLACASTDAKDFLDIYQFLKGTTKLEASIGLLVNNELGAMIKDIDPLDAVRTPSTGQVTGPVNSNSNNSVPPAFQSLTGVNIVYLKAGANEKLESFLKQNPHSNTMDFLRSLERNCCGAIGWPWEIIRPDLGKPAMQGIAENVRNEIDTFQSVIEQPMKLAVLVAIAKAMKAGIIPDNSQGDWQSFSFTKPAEFTLDAKYSKETDAKELMLGLNNRRSILAKYGINYDDNRRQILQEQMDDIADAQEVVKASGGKLSFEYALNRISKRYDNPTQQQPSTPEDS